MIPDVFWDIVSCPHCGSEILLQNRVAVCSNCTMKYKRNKNGIFDFRLQESIKESVSYRVSSDYSADIESDVLRHFTKNPAPEVDIDLSSLSPRDEKQLSYLPAPDTDEEIAVEIGTMSAGLRPVIEEAGYDYIGMDITSPDAPLLADGRAIPLSDNSTDFVITSRVLEHVRHPYLVIKEIERILRPGGRIIGSVAFIEPWHGYSNFHMSHSGVYNLLNQFEFDIKWISPDIHGLRTLSYMGLFRRIPRDRLAELIVSPLILLNVLWYKVGRICTGSEYSTDLYRRLRITSGINFCADKIG